MAFRKTRALRLTTVTTLAVLAITTFLVAARPAAAATGVFVSAWGAAPARGVTRAAANFTCRQTARSTLMGAAIRIHLSNAHGSAPVTFGAVTAAIHQGGGVTATPVPVRFGGRRDVTVSAGGRAVSDPVPMRVAAGTEIAVSLHVPGAVSTFSEHEMAGPGYCTAFDGTGGDRTQDTGTAGLPQRHDAVWWLDGVDVQASTAENAIVTLGDSLTDGNDALAAAYQRYPDHLSRRLQRTAAGSRLSVINMGISGNTVVAAGAASPTALARFDRDVVQQRRVRHLVLFEGINDISRNATAAQIIDGLTELVRRAHTANIAVVLATLTPRHPGCGLPDDAWDDKIEEINNWVRTTRIAEATVDFHAAVRDPRSPNCILAAYNSGDNLHFNAAGAQALANALDLSVFTSRTGAVDGPAGMCLDLPGGVSAAGTRPQLWTCLDNGPQSWTVVADDTVRAYGRCLSPASGTAVHLADCDGTGAQQWRQQADGTLRHLATGRCLATVDAATVPGSLVHLAACAATASQRFRLPTTVDPPVTGTLATPGQTCAEAAAGGAVQLARCTGTTGQQWALHGDGTVRSGGRCLDVPANSTAQGAVVALWDCHAGANQQWVQRIDGTLMNPVSQRCLDAPAGATAPGTRPVIWDCHGGANQQFRLA